MKTYLVPIMVAIRAKSGSEAALEVSDWVMENQHWSTNTRAVEVTAGADEIEAAYAPENEAEFPDPWHALATYTAAYRWGNPH